MCTIGPKSLNKNVISFFLKNKVDLFRINMSHTSIKDLEKNIKYLQKLNVKNICIDTEGAQIRTANIKKKFLKKGQILSFSNEQSNNSAFQLYPYFNFKNIHPKTLFQIGFEGLKLKVISNTNNVLSAKVITEGNIENNKGVHFDKLIYLETLTTKDREAIKLGRKLKVKYFALSFANKLKDVNLFRKLIGNKSFLISKIETRSAYQKLTEITKASNAI